MIWTTGVSWERRSVTLKTITVQKLLLILHNLLILQQFCKIAAIFGQ